MGDSGQVSSSAAEVYDEFFVPALFSEWAPRLVATAQLQPGMRVVDVACGTGVAALEAAAAVRPSGTVTGVDLNPGMLAVARRKAAEIEWLEAPAEALPLESEDVDAVLCQFGLMFFQDKPAALGEMWRVVRPGGRLAVAVWDTLENTPGYAAVTALLDRLFGPDIANLLRAPFSLGEETALRGLLADGGVADAHIERVIGEARFPSIRAWMHTDVRGWTLADKLDDAQYERLVAAAEDELRHFVDAVGTVRFDSPALIVSARKA